MSYNEPIIVSKAVIEEDVRDALPSVKALARGFFSLQSNVDETPINRPKVSVRYTSLKYIADGIRIIYQT